MLGLELGIAVLPSPLYDEENRCRCRLRGLHEVSFLVRLNNPNNPL
jgi:hypothetical protein